MEQLHAVGAVVRIHGLESDKGPQLNGKTGVVLRYSARTDRYNVRMDDQNVNANLRSVNIKRVRRKVAASSSPPMSAANTSRRRPGKRARMDQAVASFLDAASFLGIQEEGEYYPISDDESDEDDECADHAVC
jgi:hypothetical protein